MSTLPNTKIPEIFKALFHPTRLLIIQAVNYKKMLVKEFAEMVGIDISTMSKHLDILKRHKIIMGEKDKNFVYYHLAIKLHVCSVL